ncbi:hypothetical protein PR048_026014 [Dryococelus australis]|uniref:Uncharacterized protein n=1 Tax=Dryococelus australis TaxID=614101 RepID=A0ABQ9GK63_9NEOP|nr:hypothetical protein PR048_026014 [Dryococelus australis]
MWATRDAWFGEINHAIPRGNLIGGFGCGECQVVGEGLGTAAALLNLALHHWSTVEDQLGDDNCVLLHENAPPPPKMDLDVNPIKAFCNEQERRLRVIFGPTTRITLAIAVQEEWLTVTPDTFRHPVDGLPHVVTALITALINVDYFGLLVKLSLHEAEEYPESRTLAVLQKRLKACVPPPPTPPPVPFPDSSLSLSRLTIPETTWGDRVHLKHKPMEAVPMNSDVIGCPWVTLNTSEFSRSLLESTSFVLRRYDASCVDINLTHSDPVHTIVHITHVQSHRYTQHNGNTASQFSALRVGAKLHQARVSLSPLSSPRFPSSTASKTLARGGGVCVCARARVRANTKLALGGRSVAEICTSNGGEGRGYAARPPCVPLIGWSLPLPSPAFVPFLFVLTCAPPFPINHGSATHGEGFKKAFEVFKPFGVFGQASWERSAGISKQGWMGKSSPNLIAGAETRAESMLGTCAGDELAVYLIFSVWSLLPVWPQTALVVTALSPTALTIVRCIRTSNGEEIWAALNIEFLRADEVEAMRVWSSAEIQGAEETGYPGENLPNSGIVWLHFPRVKIRGLPRRESNPHVKKKKKVINLLVIHLYAFRKNCLHDLEVAESIRKSVGLGPRNSNSENETSPKIPEVCP